MSLVPLQHRIELYLNGAWVDVSTYLLDKAISHPIGTGDEARRLTPSTFGFELNNSDGRFTPGNPTSPYYGLFSLNTQVRWSVAAGDEHLTINGPTGTTASTPHHSSFNFASDCFIGVEAEGIVVPGYLTAEECVAKRALTGNQRSVGVNLDHDGAPFVIWSPDGTAAAERSLAASLSPQKLWDIVAFAVWLDVNNGASGVTATFYHARTLAEIVAAPASHILGTATSATTSSVFNSTAALAVGDSADTGYVGVKAQYRRLQVRSGDAAGTIVANPDFTAQAVGTTSFADSAGRTWTVNSPATIDKWQTRQVGEIVKVEPAWTTGDPGLPTVKITAASVTRRLQQRRKSLKSALFERITSLEQAGVVDAYWPMEDGHGATQFGTPIAGQRPITKISGLSFASDDTLPASKPLPTASGNQQWWLDVGVAGGTSGTWEFTWLVNIPTPSTPPADRIMNVWASGSAHVWIIQQDSTNVTISALDSDGGGLLLTTFPWDARFQYWSIVRLSADQNGGNIDWDIDWIPQFGAGAGLVFGTSGSFAGTCGRVTRWAKTVTGNAPPDGLSMGHAALTSGTANNWLAGADQGFAGETAAARYKRLCNEMGIPVLIQGDTTDSPKMGPQPIATILDVLDDCAQTDGGIQVEQRHTAGLGLRTLRSMYNQTPRLSLDAARVVSGSVHGDLNLPFSPALDDQRIHNDVTAVRPNGSSVRVTTTPPPADDEIYDGEVEANVEYDSGLVDVAAWNLHLGTTPYRRLWMRYPEIRSNLIDRDYIVDDFLHTGPGDTVEILNLPQHSPDALVLLQEGGTETIDTTDWGFGIVSSPGLLYEVGVRDDSDRGRRDSGTSTLTADFIAGTHTTMTVAVASGLLWTTAAGNFPQELDVGGARITVTAISGASSPQTFTVSTTVVNGVTKTVPAGTGVHVWRETVRAR